MPQTIPIIVDDNGQEAGVAAGPPPAPDILVRCIYFSFEAAEPAAYWTLTLSGQAIPFFLLHLSGIIFAPVYLANVSPNNTGEFLSPEDITRTFDMVERNQNLLVETARIYLPTWFIRAASKENFPKLQDVLRVRHDLFTRLFEHARGKLPEAKYRDELRRYAHEFEDQNANREWPLSMSPKETLAFQRWSHDQSAEAHHQLADWRSRGEARPEGQSHHGRF
jgi:hypothetical protein